VLQNCDELFEREELSAAPDPGWPDCFNTGVFVYKPSQDTFGKLLEFAKTKGSFDGKTSITVNISPLSIDFTWNMFFYILSAAWNVLILQ